MASWMDSWSYGPSRPPPFWPPCRWAASGAWARRPNGGCTLWAFILSVSWRRCPTHLGAADGSGNEGHTVGGDRTPAHRDAEPRRRGPRGRRTIVSFKVVGIGEVLWDLLPGGRQMGGAPANFAYHARALGAQAQVLSRVGRDEPGGELLARLEQLGLLTDTEEVDPTA